MEIKIIITTTDSQIIADQISKELVKNNLSPCVQIINNVSSTYKWDSEIIRESEFLLFIKTTINNVDKCKKNIEEIHNYEIPEIICLKSDIINDKYKNWFLNTK